MNENDRNSHRFLLIATASAVDGFRSLGRHLRGVEDVEAEQDGISLFLHTGRRPLVLDSGHEHRPAEVDVEGDLLSGGEGGQGETPGVIIVEADTCCVTALQTRPVPRGK